VTWGDPAAAPSRGTALAGTSAAFRALLKAIRFLADRTVAVLISGETGTGKTLIAEEIHARTAGAGALLRVNCPASGLHGLQAALAEAAERPGTAAVTVLLDEVSALSPEAQEVLLRALHEQGEEPPPEGPRLRFLATTGTDLHAPSMQDRFRRDLVFRLGQYQVRIPPLRERREDIRALADAFLPEAGGDWSGPGGTDVLEALLVHPWPGNVRELRNALAVYRALFSEEGRHDLGNLPEPVREHYVQARRAAPAAS
jgi:DNA-binding NtrC family response regulator